MHVSINAQRLWSSLMAMAEIGATPNGGSNRLALTREDTAGRQQLIEWCAEIGCHMRSDAVGNLFFRRPGARNDLAPAAVGSHLDTQPKGGRFDGVLGVLAGLEVFRTLHEHQIVTERPLELIVWTNEEGSRFAPAMVASGTYAGVFTVDETLARQDEQGIRFGQALDETGLKGQLPIGEPRLASFLELHIEQGPVLEEAALDIGVVTGVQGIRWFDLTIEGSAAHAGTTPMASRHDALAAAARLIDRLYAIAADDPSGDSKVTFGCLEVDTPSRNVIPARVTMTVDLRHVSDDQLATLEARFKGELDALVESFGVVVTPQRLWSSPVVTFNDHCIAAIEQATKARGIAYRRMLSGAGHDAVYVSRVAPTAMIFIPCRDGISHNEAEYATSEQCALGTQVLCDALLHNANHLEAIQ